MGRARGGQSVAVASDRFTGVFGNTRGAAARDRLSALKLSVTARRELSVLIAEAKRGRLSEPIAVIRREHEYLARPHLQRLVDVCAQTLTLSVRDSESERAYAALDLVAAHRRFAAQVIYDGPTSTFHLWPGGNNLTLEEVRESGRSSLTVCGLDVAGGMEAYMVPRGDYRSLRSRSSERFCPVCDDRSAEYWETTESVRKVAMLPPRELANLHGALHAEAVELLSSGTAHDVASVQEQLRVAHDRAVVAQAQAIFERNPEWVLRRLHNNGYERLRASVQLPSPLGPRLPAAGYASVVASALNRKVGIADEVAEEWVVAVLGTLLSQAAEAEREQQSTRRR